MAETANTYTPIGNGSLIGRRIREVRESYTPEQSAAAMGNHLDDLAIGVEVDQDTLDKYVKAVKRINEFLASNGKEPLSQDTSYPVNELSTAILLILDELDDTKKRLSMSLSNEVYMMKDNRKQSREIDKLKSILNELAAQEGDIDYAPKTR